MVSAFPFSDIVKDCPKMRNFPRIFLRSFENVGPGSNDTVLTIYSDVRFQVIVNHQNISLSIDPPVTETRENSPVTSLIVTATVNESRQNRTCCQLSTYNQIAFLQNFCGE